MKRRILVTGGTGFLGAALVRSLVSKGHFVRVLDNGFRSSISSLQDILDQIEMVQGDIRDINVVINSIEKMDTVIHLSAINGTEFFYSQPSLVLDVGVRGILNVIDGCHQCGVKNLLVASSSEVYQMPSKIPTDETEKLVIPDVLNPRYSYGGSKIITELLLLHQCRTSLDRAIIFRPHNVYGPSMGQEHVLPQFIMRALECIGRYETDPVPFPIQGNGTETRSFIHIDDMVEGIILLLERGEHLNIYHIGTTEEISIAKVAEKIFKYFKRKCIIQPNALQPGSTKRRCPNIDKIKQLGFFPKISLDEGLPSMIEWYLHQKSYIGVPNESS